jgi:hypothetical protein
LETPYFLLFHEYFLFFHFWLPLEHGASMKRSVLLHFLNVGQSVGHRKYCTYTGQLQHKINVRIHINIHASRRIRTYDPGIQVSQDSSCPRPLSYRDRHEEEW